MKIKTFKFRIILLFLFISLPTIGLSLVASYTNVVDAQQKIINARQNNMKILVRQYDTDLGAVENYINLLLYKDNNYAALRADETNTRYQQARVWLKDELSNTQTCFPLMSGFYVRVPHNEDIYIVRRSEMDLDVQDFLKAQIPLAEPANAPCVLQYEGLSFLLRAWSNRFFEIGVILPLEELCGQFQEGMEAAEAIGLSLAERGEQFLIFNGERQADGLGDLGLLEERFSTMDVRLQLYYEKNVLTMGIPLWNRSLLYLSLLLLVLFPIFSFAIRKWFLLPMKKISSAMQEILKGKTEYRIQEFSNVEEFSEIEQAFNQVLNYSQNLKIKAYELENEKKQEEITNLRLQINPHLLLNSLNTICSLAVNGKTDAIWEFSMNLSKYFRYALRDTTELVTIQSEIDFIRAYNKVQKIRYPDAFYIVYDVEEELMPELIPPLIIQNFVENSTKYALKPNEEIEILVIIRKEDSMLRISVCDNGRGMAPEFLEKIRRGEVIYDSRGMHIGIRNSMNRLRRLYGDKAQIQVTSEKGIGTQIWIEIPTEEGNDESADR